MTKSRDNKVSQAQNFRNTFPKSRLKTIPLKILSPRPNSAPPQVDDSPATPAFPLADTVADTAVSSNSLHPVTMKSASPELSERFGDSKLIFENQVASLANKIFDRINSDYLRKTYRVSATNLQELVVETVKHIVAESIEVLSWIPIAAKNMNPEEIPLTILHYKHSLFGTMREVGLKAHNFILEGNLKYFNNRIVHVVEEGDKNVEVVSGRYLDEVKTRHSSKISCKHARVFLPQCPTSEKVTTPAELKELLDCYRLKGADEIVPYRGRNADGELGEVKHVEWVKQNAWLENYRGEHKQVRLLERNELVRSKEYQCAQEVFSKFLITSDEITNSIEHDVTKNVIRLLKKGRVQLDLKQGKEESFPSPNISPMPETAITPLPLLDRQLSEGVQQKQMVHTLSLVAEKPKLKEMMIQHPTALGAFFGSFFREVNSKAASQERFISNTKYLAIKAGQNNEDIRSSTTPLPSPVFGKVRS